MLHSGRVLFLNEERIDVTHARGDFILNRYRLVKGSRNCPFLLPNRVSWTISASFDRKGLFKIV